MLRIIGTSTGKIYVQIQEDKIYAMSCKKATMSGVSYAEKIAEGMSHPTDCSKNSVMKPSDESCLGEGVNLMLNQMALRSRY